jgi:NAD(P)-dependent dehydrogenase (short-subunit alcohol dehydrogenase family)
MLLENKIIIVTGGASGIGRVYCDNLWREGAHLLIADLDLGKAEALADSLNDGSPRRAVALRVDVTNECETEAMARVAFETFGHIDVLINNVGLYPHMAFEEISYETWRLVVATNLDSAFLCAKAVLPYMKRQQHGKIINVGTNLVWTGLAGMVHYIAAKAGIVGFTRALAREVGEHGITVNALAPGAVIPDMELTGTPLQRVETIVGYQCLKRRLRPEDLVGPIIFLSSADADFITGQILTVDGGLTNH